MLMSKISEKYTQINCLYNINSLKNLKSIMNYGILSKNLLKNKAPLLQMNGNYSLIYCA